MRTRRTAATSEREKAQRPAGLLPVRSLLKHTHTNKDKAVPPKENITMQKQI